MKEKKVLKTLRFPVRMLEQLDELAQARGVTVTALVLEGCRQTLAAAGYEVGVCVYPRRRGEPAPEKPRRPRGRPKKSGGYSGRG